MYEMMKNEKNVTKNTSDSKNLIYKILFIIFTLGAVVCIGLMIYGWWIEKQAQNQYDNLLSTETESQIPTETEEPDILDELGITVPEKNLNWKELKETNEHIYAWIYIPGTRVDYPVLQHSEDDSYYLDYNLDGSKGYPGCIYSQHRYNTTDFTDFNTVLYGHDMKNGTMFATLHDFEDKTFFEEHRYIYIYTPEHTYVYDIFGAYTFSDVHILNHYKCDTVSRCKVYLKDVFAIRDMSAHFREGVEVTEADHILTLSTCISGRPNNRYLVQGVLVNPPETSVTEKEEAAE